MDGIQRAAALFGSVGRFVSFSGAGLSAESGIATFRDPQTGHWAKYDPMRLASPEGFAEDPGLVIDWYNHRRKVLAGARPNQAHQALASRRDFVHATQNVDHLLEAAGARDVAHLHGRIDADRCQAACGFVEDIAINDPPDLRPCPDCGALLRPTVVWFGEALPTGAWETALSAARSADAMLVIGTSAAIYPAAGIVDEARATGATVVEVNIEPSISSADLSLIGPAAELVPRILIP